MGEIYYINIIYKVETETFVVHYRSEKILVHMQFIYYDFELTTKAQSLLQSN